MTLQEAETKVRELDDELAKLTQLTGHDLDTETIRTELEKAKERVLAMAYANLTSYDRVYLARKPTRPNVREYIENIFDHFFEQRGDRLYGNDEAIIGGVAGFHWLPGTGI